MRPTPSAALNTVCGLGHQSRVGECGRFLIRWATYVSVLNVKIAALLGLEVPSSILAAVDDTVE